jgi:4-amino-4-deoxy-L-arabinose transferase-like glycosyltransferase
LRSDDPQSYLDRRTLRILLATCLALLAGYLIYSQTLAFHWDEGFHLLAARLISTGKKPYIDYCFPQAPLNAYWNALWLRVFHDSWRATHVAATLVTIGAIALLARFLLTRFPDSAWRGSAAIVASLLFGLNVLVLQYGNIAQAYAMSMLMITAAMLASAAAVEREQFRMAALAGLFAGAAVSSTMLAAAAGPVFLLWILIYNQRGSRFAKFASFSAGAFVAFSPMIFLLAKGPRQTWFNLVQYHVAYRRVAWPGAGIHDVDILSSWTNRTQGMILALLALAGVLYLRRCLWNRGERAPFILCIWVMLAVGLQNGFAHPTFPQYFIPMAPAMTVLATLGMYAFATRLAVLDRPAKLIATITVIFLLGTARGVFDDRDDFTWRKVERSAKKVEEVTPKGGTVLGAEQIYFLTHRPVPEGLEFQFAEKLDFGTERNKLLHIVPRKEMERRISARMYQTDAVCDDNDEIERVDGLGIYAQKADMGECTVFWDLKPAGKDDK